MKILTTLLAVLTLAPLAHAQSVPDQHQVVPGERLGRVFLGDSRKTVARRLGKPAKVIPLGAGLTSELWRGSIRTDTGSPNTLEVIYRRGVVIQIETTNPLFKTKSGLSVLSDGPQWEKLLRKPTISYREYPKRAEKVYQYHDWRRAGLALEMIESEDSPSPETLIVHRKGYRVIPDIGGIPIH